MDEEEEEGEPKDDGESVRDNAINGSLRVKVGDWTGGGRSGRQKVSVNLISSWTYLSISLCQS